jgi:hypothetical protein
MLECRLILAICKCIHYIHKCIFLQEIDIIIKLSRSVVCRTILAVIVREMVILSTFVVELICLGCNRYPAYCKYIIIYLHKT